MIKPMIVIIKNLHVSGMQRWESQASLVSLPLFPISCRRIVWLSFLFSLHPWLKGTRRDLTNSEVMCVKILNYKEKSFKVLKSTMTAVSMSNHILYNYQGSFFFFLIRSRPKYTFVMRLRKRRANVVKNTQLERNRLQSLKIDNSLNDGDMWTYFVALREQF